MTKKFKTDGGELDPLELINKTYKRVLGIYPFLNKEERKNFIEKAEKIIKNANKVNAPIKSTTLLLELLPSPGHATVTAFKSKREPNNKQNWSWNLDKKTLYLKIAHWGPRDWVQQIINLCLEKNGKYNGVIIDVRSNSGGNSFAAHDLAGLFFNKTVEYGTTVVKTKTGLEKRLMIMPNNFKAHIKIPLVILVDNKCFSSNELFLAPFKITKRAILIGEKTRGGSANPEQLLVTANDKRWCIWIPRWRFFLKGKRKPIEETGIEPDFKASEPKEQLKLARKILEEGIKKEKKAG